MRGRVVVLGFVVLAVSAVVVGFAVAQSEAPDHDYALAVSKFGGNPECPKGRVIGTAEWEKLAQRMAEIESPPGVDLATVDPLDYVLVIPDDPQPYLKTFDEVPPGRFAVVPCVAVSADRMVLADDSAVLFAMDGAD